MRRTFADFMDWRWKPAIWHFLPMILVGLFVSLVSTHDDPIPGPLPMDTLACSKFLPTVIEPEASWELFEPAWNHTEKTVNALEGLLDDPADRLEKPFKIPEGLRARVLFWAQIYGVYPSHTKLVHDRKFPGRRLGVINFAKLPRQEMPSDRIRNRIEGAIMHRVRTLVREAFDLAPPRYTSEAERFRIRLHLARMGVTTSKEARQMARRLRTQKGQRDSFMRALNRSQDLLPEMEKIFKEARLPKGLTRIPFVESSFYQGAHSKVGAMGIWQFMPTTAKFYIKDRSLWRDPMGQTKGAALMLRDYYRLTGQWGLAITAYNSGVGRVRRLKRNLNADTASEMLLNEDVDQGLGFAGQNFLSEVLAANLVEAYKTQVFLPWDIHSIKDSPKLVAGCRFESKPPPSFVQITPARM